MGLLLKGMHEIHGIRLFDEVEESILSGRVLEPELMEASVDGRKISAHRHLKIVSCGQKIEGVEKIAPHLFRAGLQKLFYRASSRALQIKLSFHLFTLPLANN